MLVSILFSATFFGLALWATLAFRSQLIRGPEKSPYRTPTDDRESSDIILLAFIAGSALMGWAVLWTARSVTIRWVLEPIEKLNRAAERMSAGEIGVRTQVEGRVDEIGRLAESFDRMAITIEKRGSQLATAETAARSGLDMFRKVIEATPLAVIGVDPEGKVWLWNPAAEKIFGWTEAEVLGRLNPIVPPDRMEGFRSSLAATLKGEFVQIEGNGRVRKDGVPIDTRLWASAVTDPNGRRLGIGIIEDITARRKAEEQAFRIQKMDTIGRLAAGWAHDCNNLLTAISANTQLLTMRADLPAGARSEAQAIDAATLKAEEMMKRVLAFGLTARSNARTVDLNALLREFEKSLRPLLNETIRLDLDLDRGAGPVQVDPAQVEQILMNLALNARDAMPAGGTLRIHSGQGEPEGRCSRKDIPPAADGCVHIEVSDTGIGMNEEVKSHLFEPFFTTKPVSRGTGLGLATVFGIVRQSNGSISVESAPGRGSTFTICLPRYVEAGGNG